MLGAQLAEVSAHQPWQPSALGEQLVGEIEGVADPTAGPQDNRQQINGRERLGAEVLQAHCEMGLATLAMIMDGMKALMF